MSGDFEQAKSRVCQSEGTYVTMRPLASSWEQRKLGECIDSFSAGPNILGSYSNDGDYLVKMGNMRRGEFVLDRIERLPKGFAINNEDYLAPGDFLFNTRNTFEMAGKGATWRIGQGKYTFNSNIARVRFSCLDSYFMNYLYNTEQVIEQVRARVTGTTSVAAVYLNSLNTVQIAFPELGEQRRIGTFFTELDSLITLHQREPPHMMKEDKNANRYQRRIAFLRLLLAMD